MNFTIFILTITILKIISSFYRIRITIIIIIRTTISFNCYSRRSITFYLQISIIKRTTWTITFIIYFTRNNNLTIHIFFYNNKGFIINLTLPTKIIIKIIFLIISLIFHIFNWYTRYIIIIFFINIPVVFWQLFRQSNRSFF